MTAEIITLAGLAIGFIVWLIRLEGKVITANKVFDLHKENCKNLRSEEKTAAEKDRQEVLDSMDKLYDLIRELSGKVDKILGWREGQQGK